MATYIEVQNEGVKAFESGKPRKSNPYIHGEAPEWHWWDSGWLYTYLEWRESQKQARQQGDYRAWPLTRR